jgi:hypothetical protein
VRELQRGPLIWSNTRVCIQHTTRPPASQSRPHTRSNPDATVLPAQREHVHRPCHLPTAYITSRVRWRVRVIPRCVSKNQPRYPLHPSLPGLVPREWLRVTDAPVSSCVGSRRSRCSVEGGVQVEVEEGVSSQPARAERVPHSSLLAVLGWVCVYGVAGCTADSSRVDTGGSVRSGAAPLSGTPRAPMERRPSALHVRLVSQCVHRWAARTVSTGLVQDLYCD